MTEGSDIEALVTLRDWVRWGASRFNEAGLCFGHGTDNALDEAYVLCCHALHLPPRLPNVYLPSRLTSGEREAVRELLLQRIDTRKPAAYLAGEAWFAGLSFYVDERVLVPRSPIAELIEQAFEPWVEPAAVERVLDIGTGSGCIAIATALALPQARVDAVDVSDEALAVARRNIADYGLDERVRPIRSDLFGALDGQAYDLIVANPPYVGERELASLPQEYRHEPRTGLYSEAEGLAAMLRILAGTPEHLTDSGVLVGEVGASWPRLAECLPELPFVWVELERGGEGVFVVGRETLVEHAPVIEAALDTLVR